MDLWPGCICHSGSYTGVNIFLHWIKSCWYIYFLPFMVNYGSSSTRHWWVECVPCTPLKRWNGRKLALFYYYPHDTHTICGPHNMIPTQCVGHTSSQQLLNIAPALTKGFGDASLISHRWTDGRQPWEIIGGDGWPSEKPKSQCIISCRRPRLKISLTHLRTTVTQDMRIM